MIQLLSISSDNHIVSFFSLLVATSVYSYTASKKSQLSSLLYAKIPRPSPNAFTPIGNPKMGHNNYAGV